MIVSCISDYWEWENQIHCGLLRWQDRRMPDRLLLIDFGDVSGCCVSEEEFSPVSINPVVNIVQH